jgi:hypothetical protein
MFLVFIEFHVIHASVTFVSNARALGNGRAQGILTDKASAHVDGNGRTQSQDLRLFIGGGIFVRGLAR